MNMQNIEIFDISKSNLINSKLNIDVFKLFNKIKKQCSQSNPLTAEGIMSHLFNCVKLFNTYKIDSMQLANSIKSLFGQNFPYLYHEFLNTMQRIQKETNNSENKSKLIKTLNSHLTPHGLRKDLIFSSLNDCGPSYRLLPSDYKHKLCSGRLNNKICSECLNDNYICFPSMTSEDTSAVSSKKNPHEEHLHRLEDERYEVDMFQEINKYALKHLSDINKKMDSMTKEEKLKFQLDENIGGSSAILMRKAIYRIYGDATDNMIEGLKVRPKMAIPLVISRMQEKAKEWNQIHSKFKMVWEDRANKHYWQSLDYQGDWIKRDAIFLKRSTFFSQIESLSKGFLPFQEDFLMNHDFLYEMSSTKSGIYGNLFEICGNHNAHIGPHMTLLFPADSDLFFNCTGVCIRDIIDNANSLITNQIHLQYNLSKEDKSLLIEYIFQIIGYFFDNPGSQVPQMIIGSIREQKDRKSERYITSPVDRRLKNKRPNNDDIDEQVQSSAKKPNHNDVEDTIGSKPLKYNMMVGNSYIYTFIRLYHVLIDRLTVLKIHALRITHDDNDSDDLSGNDDICHDESDKYTKVFKLLLDSSDSNSESTTNIDSKIRELSSTKAFLWFTIPRIVQQIVKTSQQLMCAGLESSKDLLDLYCLHSTMWPNGGSGTGGFMTNREFHVPKERKYVNDAIEFCTNQGLLCFLIIYIRQQGRLLIELIDTDNIKVLNGTSNAFSELGSTPVSPDHQLKQTLDQEEIDNSHLTSYERYRNHSLSSFKLQNCKNQKVYPLFLMKNVKKGIRALTNRSLEISKHESLRRSFPSMEEVAFMKLIQSRSQFDKKDSSIVLDHLHPSLSEIYRCALIGDGEIYNFLFERSKGISTRNGFLYKKQMFRKNDKAKKFRKISVDEIMLKHLKNESHVN